MFYKLLALLLVFVPQFAHANVWMPTLAGYTKTAFLSFDIWWILICMLLEIGIFRFFIKQYSLQRLTIAVLLANIVSICVGILITVIAPLEMLYKTLMSFLIQVPNLSRIGLPVYISAATQIVLFTILTIMVNTIIEYPVYYLYLKDVAKKRLLWITLLANVLTYIFMIIIMVGVHPEEITFKVHAAPYSAKALVKKVSPNKEQNKIVSPKKRSSRK